MNDYLWSDIKAVEEKSVLRASGKAFSVILESARHLFPHDESAQRVFIATCIEQIKKDLLNL